MRPLYPFPQVSYPGTQASPLATAEVKHLAQVRAPSQFLIGQSGRKFQKRIDVGLWLRCLRFQEIADRCEDGLDLLVAIAVLTLESLNLLGQIPMCEHR